MTRKTSGCGQENIIFWLKILDFVAKKTLEMSLGLHVNIKFCCDKHGWKLPCVVLKNTRIVGTKTAGDGHGFP